MTAPEIIGRPRAGADVLALTNNMPRHSEIICAAMPNAASKPDGLWWFRWSISSGAPTQTYVQVGQEDQSRGPDAGEWWEWKIPHPAVPAGKSLFFGIIAALGPNLGKTKQTLNGVDIGDMDLYVAGGYPWGVRFSYNLPGPQPARLYTLRQTVVAKNAASTDTFILQSTVYSGMTD